ncbi:MAG: hypothetical protein AB9903_25435 [Vulcanimicrobiota bacterium]
MKETRHLRRDGVLLSLIISFLLYFSSAPVKVSAETVSKTGKDSLSITAVTPGSETYIVTPSRFCYRAHLLYSLKSRERASIVLKVYRLPQGGQKETLASSQKMPVVNGSNTLLMSSDELDIRTAPSKDEKILFLASMIDDEGKEMAFSSSVNFLTGSLADMQKGAAASRDYIQILSVAPQPGMILPPGAKSRFDFKIAYNICKSTDGFALLWFCTMKDMEQKSCLREYYVPVPQGKGILTIRLPVLTLPAARRGEVLGIIVNFRPSYEGRSISTDRIWPYNIAE